MANVFTGFVDQVKADFTEIKTYFSDKADKSEDQKARMKTVAARLIAELVATLSGTYVLGATLFVLASNISILTKVNFAVLTFVLSLDVFVMSMAKQKGATAYPDSLLFRMFWESVPTKSLFEKL